ncbi:hypothetical protein E2C01_026458 [Portunus trituberculatus]|uniref:Uncharacterized protein n=1 Tax=Portunus trituberculatus TaxID=210409 RepID=A0A5B7EI76_PORTR|nr:hypothetical protein [Portunus trituberculatus]
MRVLVNSCIRDVDRVRDRSNVDKLPARKGNDDDCYQIKSSKVFNPTSNNTLQRGKQFLESGSHLIKR